MTVYRRLRARNGPSGWWPGETPLEICLGAILVQNTAWTNVEKALSVLRDGSLLSFDALRALPAAALAPLIRSSGYFNLKARRLAEFLAFLEREYGGRVETMRDETPLVLRAKLLAVAGIGRETADSIVLYAAGLPIFVVDAYTRRIFSRLGLIEGDEDYDVIRALFERRLPRDAALYNEYHAQIVRLGKDVCRRVPLCDACALTALCPRRGVPRVEVEPGQASRAPDRRARPRPRPAGPGSRYNR
jgi:endonuclease III related protein